MVHYPGSVAFNEKWLIGHYVAICCVKRPKLSKRQLYKSRLFIENVLTVAHRHPELCSGYLILVAGSLTWPPRNLRPFKICVKFAFGQPEFMPW